MRCRASYGHMAVKWRDEAGQCVFGYRLGLDFALGVVLMGRSIGSLCALHLCFLGYGDALILDSPVTCQWPLEAGMRRSATTFGTLPGVVHLAAVGGAVPGLAAPAAYTWLGGDGARIWS